jgi:DNA modification methylase
MRVKLGRDPEWDEILAVAREKGLHIYEGASIFDPVVAEIVYRWFCPDKAVILDPFAGGSVRGIVAGLLGYKYVGIDLRPDQVSANNKQRDSLQLPSLPVWITGDSNQVLDDDAKDLSADFVFSCPPYHDLEQYSDDPKDLSNMPYDGFMRVYQSIIGKAVAKLKDNRFACFVVADIRDKQGLYRNFVSDTIQAFLDAGMHLYNEIILVNVAGSLPIRVGRQFEAYRKVGKMHQNILVFYKGDPKKIKEEFPEIKVPDVLQVLDSQPNIALT